MKKIHKIRIGNWKLGFQWWFQKVYDRIGIDNTCFDGKYVPFWDFQDDPVTPLSRITIALNQIADEWGLSTIYVVQSSPHESYRAFCFDKVDFRENLAILAETDWVDQNYLRSFARYKRSVIRVIPKRERGDHDKIVSQLDHTTMLRPKSLQHAFFFHKMYGVGSNVIPVHLNIKRSQYESFR